MKKSQGMNALLIELVIVLFFFILSFTVLAQVYACAYRTENDTALQSQALFEARNLCARLRVQDDPEQFLQAEAAKKTENGYVFICDGYELLVICQPEKMENGVYYRMQVDARQGESALWMPQGEEISLHASVYVPEVSSFE